MESKRKRAVIYPYGVEFAPVVRHRKLLSDYELSHLVSPKGWGIVGQDAGQADKGEEIGITVEGDFVEAIDNSDILIVADCNTDDNFKKKIISNIDLAIQKGKDIICALTLDSDVLESIDSKCKENKLKFKYMKNTTIQLEYDRDNLLHIETPIVFVAGLTETTNKFEIQLSLREHLIKNGYNVSQIGSRSYCELMGFHSIPDFMCSNQIGEISKIVQFNRYVKEIELSENPDIIIIGIPGGLMPFNKDLTNKFGVEAFLISQAVSPDFTVISVLYDDLQPKYFNMLSTSFKYKYGFNVDCFNMSTSQFDIVGSKELEKLCFNNFDAYTINNIIKEKYYECDIPIYNILSNNDSKMIYQLLINTLCEFSSREQMSVGGL